MSAAHSISTLVAISALSALLAACSGNDAARIGGVDQNASASDPSEQASGGDDDTRTTRARVAIREGDAKQFNHVPDAAPQVTCDDCRTSQCKTEFDTCTADATCPFLRTCLDACASSSCRSACFVQWPDPVAKAKNGALYKCQCLTRCVSECSNECS
jgi:hypothetical protein